MLLSNAIFFFFYTGPEDSLANKARHNNKLSKSDLNSSLKIERILK